LTSYTDVVINLLDASKSSAKEGTMDEGTTEGKTKEKEGTISTGEVKAKRKWLGRFGQFLMYGGFILIIILIVGIVILISTCGH